MGVQRIPSIPFELQDQLADIQHDIYAAVRNHQLEDDFVLGRLRALLGSPILETTSRQLTPGLLAYLEYEVRERLYRGFLDPDVALLALTDLLTDGRQLVADRYASQLTADLDRLAAEFPQEHAAYLLLPQLRLIGIRSSDFPDWIPSLAEVDSRWGESDLGYPAGLSERLQKYINRRKRTAFEALKQMVAAGFESNTPLIKLVQHQAVIEASMFAVTFSFWDYLRMAALKQSKQAAQAA